MLTLDPDRIRERLKAVNMSPREASLRTTRSPDMVRFILSGKQTHTTHEKTLRLAAVLECSVEYLTGQSRVLGHPPKVETFPLESEAPRAKTTRTLEEKREAIDRARGALEEANGRKPTPWLVNIPEYDVKLSAGPGALISSEEPRANWGVPRTFLESMRLDPGKLAIVSIMGESMEPLLRDGDIVMLDLRSRDPALPGIYALFEGSATVCKRVEVVHGSDPLKLRVMSVNPAYSTYEVLAEEANVIGRVAWYGRRT